MRDQRELPRDPNRVARIWREGMVGLQWVEGGGEKEEEERERETGLGG